MKIPSTHRWDLTPSEAVALQRELAGRVIERDEFGAVHYVAGVDVGFEGERNRVARAAVVVLNYPDLTPVDYAVARMPVTFPYIPGLLSFREIPVILRAFQKIRFEPDLTIADGHGRAHPRRIGFASHLGLVLDRPTIGCAKSLLVGKAEEPGNEPGAWTPLVDRDEIIGAVLRTRAKTKPVYVSTGYRVSLDGAMEWVLKCCKRYRLPETTRYAHRAAGGEKILLGGDHGRQ
ncbi:MAG TPA: deoxyribonuclease V [Anaerolineae bacterium]